MTVTIERVKTLSLPPLQIHVFIEIFRSRLVQKR